MGVFELYFTGVTNSEKYDTTLMICLLRNLTSIIPPTSGFDRLPPPAEKGDGADLARIKYYRNMFAHPEDHVMNTAAFKVARKTLTEAIENIGGTQYKSMCEDVRKKFQKPEMKHTSTATDDKLGHFDDYLTSNFSHLHLRLHRCECYGQFKSVTFFCIAPLIDSMTDSHELEIESWEEEDKRFVKTPATDVIMNILKDKNIITITGRSGVELDELGKQADKTKLCSLFLLVVYNGSICKSFFDEEIHENSQKTVNAVFESCGVSRGTPLCLLEKHLDAFVDIYLKKIGGQYATIHATHFGYTDFIRFILQHTDVNNCFEEDLPLSAACSTGNVEVVNTFIAEGFDVACSNSDGRNCLHAACETGQTRIVKILLDKGSSINTGLKNGSTPLMIASNGGYTETVKQLLQSGAKINTRNRDENTALFFACFNGHHLSAELLVTNGANITEDFGRVYPLLAACIKACASGSSNLINILLSNGANEQVNDASYINGTTPLMSAAARGHVQIVDLLLQHNADANYAANNGFTATMEASLNGHIPVVDFLNHNKSTLKREGKNNYTNLMAACMGSHVDMIKFLIEKGENISHRSRKQWCSLMCASKYGNDKVISFLLDKGLDINSADLLGNTALIIASFLDNSNQLMC
ncbi:unnamed protein product [Mytilus edulis]|uniref:DZIP3-like HEPN domain-containing protein n=1 Tax=Mytilus edulis TaxID=6550 RepID=A0A8S3VFU4_MYTED|nr:unnamed protein product [Mytilus edulis]